MKQLISRILIIVFCLLVAFHGSGQTIRQKIISLTDSIAKDNVLKSRGVGFGGVSTKQWENFEQLKAAATTQELALLTDHENGVVRCYSFQALVERKDYDFFPLLVNHLNDSQNITTFRGCIINSQSVGDCFLGVVNYKYLDSNLSRLTEYQRKEVDSLLLFDKSIKIAAKDDLLRNIKPNDKFYQRIREMAITEKNPVAILALARFQNPSDISIILTLFENEETEYYGAYAAREYPDQSFYPFWKNIFEKEWSEKYYSYLKWRILYQALAKYPNETTYKLFERTLNTKDNFRYQTLGMHLSIAIAKYPNEVYVPLKSKINLDKFSLEGVKNELNIEK